MKTSSYEPVARAPWHASLHQLCRLMLTINMLWLGACSSCGEEVGQSPAPKLQDMSDSDMPVVMKDMAPEAPRAARIEFSETSALLEIGTTRAVTYEVFDQNNLPMDPLPLVTWSSTNISVARSRTFSEERRFAIETVSVGETTITAQTSGGVSATIDVEVTPRVPVRIEVAPMSASVLQRDTVQLTAKVLATGDFELLDRQVSWTSGDEQIATVNPAGLVTGQGAGMTRVTATLDGLTATVEINVSARMADRIRIINPPITMLVNDRVTLTAEVRDDRGGVLNDRPVTWSIGDGTLASIDPQTNMLTAHRSGSSTLTASSGLLTETLDITINDRAITSIVLLPDNDTILIGETVQMIATVLADDGSEHPDQAITWSVQHGGAVNVTSINDTGLVTGLAAGTSRVIAHPSSAPTIQDTESFITVIAPIDTIVISPATVTLIQGEQITLQARTFDQNASELFRQVAWRSADPLIATIDPNGRVTAQTPGTTQVFAEAESISQPVAVEVLPIPLARLEVAPRIVTLLPTETAQITASFFDANDNPLGNRMVSWQSSAPSIASVNASTGLVTAVTTGRATITATSEGRSATAEIVVPVLFKNILTGGSHSCVMTINDTYHCFGRNQFNVLGLTGTTDRLVPTQAQVPAGGFAQLSSLTLHQCALTTQNKLFCWGANFAGQLGIGSSTGSTPSPTPIAASRDFMEVSAGGAHTCAIESGTLATYCWGSNDYGQLGTNAVDQETSPTLIAGGHLFSSISVGGSHSCAIEELTGKLFCWGRNDAGQLGINNQFANVLTPTEVDNARSYLEVVSGPEHTCALTTANETYCWGGNSDGQLGTDTGSVDSVTHLLVPGGHSFVSIDAALLHTCGITQAGEMYCWGANNNGQLGNGTSIESASPSLVSGGLTFTRMDLGGLNTCALSTSQIAYCWGSGSNGRIGNGSLSGSTVPFPLTL